MLKNRQAPVQEGAPQSRSSTRESSVRNISGTSKLYHVSPRAQLHVVGLLWFTSKTNVAWMTRWAICMKDEMTRLPSQEASMPVLKQRRTRNGQQILRSPFHTHTHTHTHTHKTICKQFTNGLRRNVTPGHVTTNTGKC